MSGSENDKNRCAQCEEGFVAIDDENLFENVDPASKKKRCYQMSEGITRCKSFEVIYPSNSAEKRPVKVKCALCDSEYYPRYFLKEEVDMTLAVNSSIN